MTPAGEPDVYGYRCFEDGETRRTRYIAVRRSRKGWRLVNWKRWRTPPARGIGCAGCHRSACPEARPSKPWTRRR